VLRLYWCGCLGHRTLVTLAGTSSYLVAKMLHLLALKRQMHCYRCGEPYYQEDGKQHGRLKADCPKEASQAELNGEPLKVWAKNKPLAEICIGRCQSR